MADLLVEDPPEKDRRAFVERLRTQLGRIQSLVAALLKLARLDAGTAAFKSEPVDVRRLIERALKPLRSARDQRQRLRPWRGRCKLYRRPQLERGALTNVVKNCVEHTPEGGKIEITYGANALYAEITVSDDGEGIASRDLPNIFNRFYRGENAGENSVGIGLALAKAIFTAQGGDISIRSQRGMGTSFKIRLFRGWFRVQSFLSGKPALSSALTQSFTRFLPERQVTDPWLSFLLDVSGAVSRILEGFSAFLNPTPYIQMLSYVNKLSQLQSPQNDLPSVYCEYRYYKNLGGTLWKFSS